MMVEDKKDKEKVPYWQVFYDDIFLLFFLSAAIMFILYTVWGLMEIGNTPVLPEITFN